MKLGQVKEGVSCVVLAVEGEQEILQAMRFGIESGTRVLIQKNIRGGPVVVCKNQLEIAIGRDIAMAIEVSEGGQ